jgi:drug/metabolite transporter (DMT)-like permease
MNTKSHIALSVACIFWATSFIATKIALTSMGVMTLAGSRHVAACICFLGWAVFNRKRIMKWPPLTWKHFRYLFILSLFSVSIHHVSQIIGLKYTTAANASIYVAIGPIMIFLIAALFLKERMTLQKIVGVLFALFGVICVTGIETLLAFDFSGRLFGDSLVALSVFTWACFTVFSKKWVPEMAPLQLTAIILLLGTASLVPFMIHELQHPEYSLSHINNQSWAAAIFLGITSSFIAVLLYLYALKNTESQKVAIYLYTIPPMTAFMAVYILNETITLQIIAGTLFVFFGLYLTQRK